MKLNPLLFLALLPFHLFCQSINPSQNLHQNHRIFAVNKEAPHATLFPFGSEATALQHNRDASRWFQSLNGLWKFYWVRRPADRPAAWYHGLRLLVCSRSGRSPTEPAPEGSGPVR